MFTILFFFFSPQGIRPKHPPLREARAKVRGVRGEGRGKDRRDKRGQSPFGARHHVIHSASGPSGRGLLAHDGHPSGRFGSRPFSTRRRVSIGMAFLYLSSSIPFQILSGESLITTLDFVRHVSQPESQLNQVKILYIAKKFYYNLLSKLYHKCVKTVKCNVKKTIRKFLPFFIHPYTFDPLSKIVNRSERVRGKKPARELARTSVDGK